jgi:hypothetical protein
MKSVPSIGTGNTLKGNGLKCTTFSLPSTCGDYLPLSGYYVYESATWPTLDVPYYAPSGVYVQQETTTSATPTLTIGGATVAMGRYAGVWVGSGSKGILKATGTTFTAYDKSSCAYSSPIQGCWYSVYFGGTTADGSFLSGATVEYGGYAYTGMVQIGTSTAKVSVTDTKMNNSANYGLYCGGKCSTFTGGDVTTGNTYSNNRSGGAY